MPVVVIGMSKAFSLWAIAVTQAILVFFALTSPPTCNTKPDEIESIIRHLISLSMNGSYQNGNAAFPTVCGRSTSYRTSWCAFRVQVYLRDVVKPLAHRRP